MGNPTRTAMSQFCEELERHAAAKMPESKREARELHTAAGIGPDAKTGYHERKFDQGKSRIDLIPGEALEGVGEVLAYGAAKYAEDSWQLVPDAVKRYRAALLRHMAAIMRGEAVDPESGKLHIDHVATNAAFLQFFARKP